MISKDKQKNLKILILSLGGIAAVLGLFYLFLVELAPNIDTFWKIFRPGTETPQQIDRIPPPPPYLETLPKATNEENIDVSGFAEPGAKAILYLNDEEIGEVVVDNEGSFSFESITLAEGESVIQVKAVDDAGNESIRSTEHTIIIDQEKPDLVIERPEDGDSFEGEKEETIIFKGKTEPNVRVTANGQWIRVDNEGNFEDTLRLEDGENKIEVIAKDEAGNETKVELTVEYDAPEDD